MPNFPCEFMLWALKALQMHSYGNIPHGNIPYGNIPHGNAMKKNKKIKKYILIWKVHKKVHRSA